MSTNNRLKLRANDIIAKAKADYEAQLEPVVELMETLFSKQEELEEVPKLIPNSTYFRSIRYKTEKSWSRQRRVVTKVVYGNNGLKSGCAASEVSSEFSAHQAFAMLSLLYRRKKSLHLNFILINIALEEIWKIG